MSNYFALLIRVQFYFEHLLPNGAYYPKLSAPVRDIEQMEIYLRDVPQLPAANITKLSISGTEQPLFENKIGCITHTKKVCELIQFSVQCRLLPRDSLHLGAPLFRVE